MTENDTIALLARLAAFTPGQWDDLRVEAWVDKIGRECRDDAAVREAVELVIDTWTGFGAPTWQAFKEAYSSILRRRRLDVPALPEPAGIPRADAMRSLRDRAAGGDIEAREALAGFAKAHRTPVAEAIPTRPLS